MALDPDDVVRLNRLEWEMLPNDVRGLPRLPERRRRPSFPLITPAQWGAWGVRWDEDWT